MYMYASMYVYTSHMNVHATMCVVYIVCMYVCMCMYVCTHDEHVVMKRECVHVYMYLCHERILYENIQPNMYVI